MSLFDAGVCEDLSIRRQGGNGCIKATEAGAILCPNELSFDFVIAVRYQSHTHTRSFGTPDSSQVHCPYTIILRLHSSL